MNTSPTWAQIAALSARLSVEMARSNTIRETNGDNRSPEIDKIESLWNAIGVSYCRMGGDFMKIKAVCALVWAGVAIDVPLLLRAKTLFEQNYGPMLPGCTDTIAAYTKLKRWRALDHSQVQTWISKLQPGDGIIFDFSTPGHFDRHFETFIEMERNDDGSLYKNEDDLFVLVNVGFNTVPDSQSGDLGTGNQGNGQGCYVRHRPINGTVMGSVDFNTEKP